MLGDCYMHRHLSLACVSCTVLTNRELVRKKQNKQKIKLIRKNQHNSFSLYVHTHIHTHTI